MTLGVNSNRKESKRMKTKFFIVDILGFAEYNFNTAE